MTISKQIIITAVLGLSLGLGYSLYEKNTGVEASKQAQAGIAPTESLDHLPDFTYPDLQGNKRSSNEWRDRVVVLNYWASWCPPCKKEIPAFIEVQKQHEDTVQFVGIAIDDPEPVQKFADSKGINYPTLLGGIESIGLSKQLGNRFSGLPFTAIFDQNGKLAFTQTGEISREELEKQLKALL